MLAVTTLALALVAGAQGWKERPDPALLAERGYTYAALDAQIRRLANERELSGSDLELLERLILRTGAGALDGYGSKVLERLPVAGVQFMLGREAWEEKRTGAATALLSAIPRWHRYYPEARFLLADLAGKDAVSRDARVEECAETAKARAGEARAPLLRRYYTVLAEDCQALRARKAYAAAKYPEALEAWGAVSKRSHKWPWLLLERAWAHYNLKDYNRTLGLLVTYKSPLLESYTFPEAEVLTALAYFRLCLYDDALVVVDQYYNDYKPRTEALEAILKTQKGSPDFFYRLMVMGPEGRQGLHPYVQRLATQIAQRPAYALDEAMLKDVRKEAVRLGAEEKALADDHPAKGWMKDSREHLRALEENLVGRINHLVKRSMFAFVSGVYGLSEEMFKIKLEVIARKKDLVYARKKLVADRGRGDFSQVRRGRFEAFWKFHGAFWADELGDYSFGLPSNCGTEERKEESHE